MLNQRLLSGFQTEPTGEPLYFVDIGEKARVCTTTKILLIPFSDLTMAPSSWQNVANGHGETNANNYAFNYFFAE